MSSKLFKTIDTTFYESSFFLRKYCDYYDAELRSLNRFVPISLKTLGIFDLLTLAFMV